MDSREMELLKSYLNESIADLKEVVTMLDLLKEKANSISSLTAKATSKIDFEIGYLSEISNKLGKEG